MSERNRLAKINGQKQLERVGAIDERLWEKRWKQ
jgi:hypothetical protein